MSGSQKLIDNWQGFDPKSYLNIVSAQSKAQSIRQKRHRSDEMSHSNSVPKKKKSNLDSLLANFDSSLPGISDIPISNSHPHHTKYQLPDGWVTESDSSDDEDYDFLLSSSNSKVGGNSFRSRNSIAKYLYDLSENAPEYDPKSRSLSENPNISRPNEDFQGDGGRKLTGDARDFLQLQSYSKQLSSLHGTAISLVSDPTRAEMALKIHRKQIDDLHQKTLESIHLEYNPSPES